VAAHLHPLDVNCHLHGSPFQELAARAHTPGHRCLEFTAQYLSQLAAQTLRGWGGGGVATIIGLRPADVAATKLPSSSTSGRQLVISSLFW
jgi:hypothetical protein